MLEAVVPVGMVKSHREHGVTRKGQALAAGHQVDHAVPRGMAAGQAHDHARRDFMRVFEDDKPVAIFVVEGRGG
ncbi:hypothetical protein G6F62_015907 [Rhizopus arrhizus]|nr:hypothetical protein G6F62_015907 [Rhizopus arrhizus]